MVGHIRFHRPDDAHVVHVLGDMREKIGNRDPGLAVPTELKGGTVGRTGAALSLMPDGNLLSMPLIQRRLGIKGVHMRWTTIGEDVDDPLGTTRELGLPRVQRVGQTRGRRNISPGAGRDVTQRSHQTGKAKRAHAHPALLKESPPR